MCYQSSLKHLTIAHDLPGLSQLMVKLNTFNHKQATDNVPTQHNLPFLLETVAVWRRIKLKARKQSIKEKQKKNSKHLKRLNL